MPEVGVLNLQIHDNSDQAAQGLDKLAGALERVKQATAGGLKLSSVATQIKKISDAVTNNLSGDAFNKITRLADAISRLKEAGDGFRMPSMRGMGSSSGRGSIGDMEDSVRNARDGVEEIERKFTEMRGGIEGTNGVLEETTQIMQNVSWQAGGAADALKDALDAWVRFRSSHSIGAGDVGEKTANLPGFIYAEGTVTGDAELPDVEPVLRLTDGLEDARDAAAGATGAYRYYADAVEEVLSLGSGNVEMPGADALSEMANNPAKGYVDSLLDTATKADLIRMKMAAIKEQLDEGTQSGKMNEARAATLALQYRRLEEQLEKLLETQEKLDKLNDGRGFTVSGFNPLEGMGQYEDFWNNRGTAYYKPQKFHDTSNTSSDAAAKVRESTRFVDDMLQNSSKVDLLNMKMEALRDKMVAGAESGKLNGAQLATMAQQYQRLSEQADKLSSSTEESGTVMDRVRGVFSNFTDGLKNMFPALSSLGKQLMRVAKYRFLRAVIKEISDGFKEGVENVYKYSKAIGSSFSTRMDDAAAALLQMKNAIGASVAPLLQSLIPYLEIAVNWFVNMINYLNQFLALLRGQATWTRPIKASANAFDEVSHSAHGASAAMKELLADWDELNIIQSEGGDGTGGGKLGDMTDYLSMFEEVTRFDGTVRKIVDFIRDNMKDILNAVKAIGLAMLAWKISSSVEDILGKVLGGLAVSALEFYLTFDGVKSLITDGFSWGAFGEAVVGFLTGVFGLWKITGSWEAGLVLGTVIAVVATLSAIKVARTESYANMAKGAFSESGKGGLDPTELLAAVQDEFDTLTKDNTLVINSFSGAEDIKMNLRGLVSQIDNLNQVMFGTGKPSEEDVKAFQDTWRQVFTAMDELEKKDFTTIFAGLTDAFNSASKDISEQAKSIRADMLMVQEGISKEQASLRVDMENLSAKVTSGKATPEEIDEYLNGLQIIANSQRTALHSLEELQKETGGIDFSSAESAIDFVTNIGDKTTAAVDESKQAKQAAVEAAQNELATLKALYEGGRIGKDAYDSYSASLDEYIKLMDDNESAKLKEIQGISSGLYMDILDQAIDTLINGDEYKGANKEQIQTYIDTIITPLIDDMAEYPDSIDPAKLETLKGLPEALMSVITNETYYAKHGSSSGWLWGKAIDAIFGTELIDETADDWRKNVQNVWAEALGSGSLIPRRTIDEVREQFANSPEFQELMSIPAEEVQPPENGLGDALSDMFYVNLDESDFQNDSFSKMISDWWNGLWYIPPMDTPEMEYELDTSEMDGASLPAVDISQFSGNLADATDDTVNAVNEILRQMGRLDGLQISMSTDVSTLSGGRYNPNEVTVRASGGYVRSGDLVMANENGNFEMMGRMGNQPVVANNQQIVDGITSGVVQGNSGLDTRMSNIEALLNRILQKEFVAKAVPSSGWGQHAARSAEQYSRVTG